MRPSTLLFLTLIAANGVAHAVSMPMLEGFEEVEAKRVDQAWLLPGTDFSGYTRVLIDPVEVSFRRHWMRDVNRGQAGKRIEQKDAEEIAAAAREGFDEIFAAAFRKAGYEVVTTPGENVLRLTPSIRDLYIDAPAQLTTGNTRIYSLEAGEAELLLLASDSTTNAVLGVARDHREAGDHGGIGLSRLEWRTRASNRADFERLYKSWAQDSVDALADLKGAGH